LVVARGEEKNHCASSTTGVHREDTHETLSTTLVASITLPSAFG
jgi:hypothetical protein